MTQQLRISQAVLKLSCGMLTDQYGRIDDVIVAALLCRPFMFFKSQGLVQGGVMAGAVALLVSSEHSGCRPKDSHHGLKSPGLVQGGVMAGDVALLMSAERSVTPSRG